MHELSLLSGALRVAEREMKSNGLCRLMEITLEVGELSSVVPQYLMRCFPIAISGTAFAGAKLKIERVSARCRCRDCGFEYPFGETDGICPQCKAAAGEIISGADFAVKQIVAS